MSNSGNELSGTDLIHADFPVHYFKGSGGAVAPSISVSTTFRTAHPDEDVPHYSDPSIDLRNPERHIYSRYTQESTTRAEMVLSKVLNGQALTYASGLNAVYGAMIHFQPKRVAVRGGYFGCHSTFEMYKRSRPDFESIDLDDEYKPGDLCWLETPVNPFGEARDIQFYADKIHQIGGILVVDSTFAPPPLQDPFKHGADCIMHSGTKYFGGHSDLLCGVLVVKTEEDWKKLHHDRTYLGSSMGSLEAWLLLRSLKTLHLRVARQSATATALVKWLNNIILKSNDQAGGSENIPGGVLTKVWHSSLQETDSNGFNPRNQMSGGFNATFSIELASAEFASRLPHLLKYFVPATSLGGVESLCEHRKTADALGNPALVRVSIGVEELKDLKADFIQAFQQLAVLKQT